MRAKGSLFSTLSRRGTSASSVQSRCSRRTRDRSHDLPLSASRTRSWKLFGAIDEWPRKPNGPGVEPADEARIHATIRDREAITDRDHLAEATAPGAKCRLSTNRSLFDPASTSHLEVWCRLL